MALRIFNFFGLNVCFSSPISVSIPFSCFREYFVVVLAADASTVGLETSFYHHLLLLLLLLLLFWIFESLFFFVFLLLRRIVVVVAFFFLDLNCRFYTVLLSFEGPPEMLSDHCCFPLPPPTPQ